jgi:hypothetical protein
MAEAIGCSPKAFTAKGFSRSRTNVKQIMVNFNFSPPYIIEGSLVELSGCKPLRSTQPPIIS